MSLASQIRFSFLNDQLDINYRQFRLHFSVSAQSVRRGSLRQAGTFILGPNGLNSSARCVSQKKKFLGEVYHADHGLARQAPRVSTLTDR
jgi:hypothetical protein